MFLLTRHIFNINISFQRNIYVTDSGLYQVICDVKPSPFGQRDRESFLKEKELIIVIM